MFWNGGLAPSTLAPPASNILQNDPAFFSSTQSNTFQSWNAPNFLLYRADFYNKTDQGKFIVGLNGGKYEFQNKYGVFQKTIQGW